MSGPLAFLDESGDPGAPAFGGSRLFVVGLVLFADRAVAAACDARIDQLRAELGKPNRYEFHFRTNTHTVRQIFLQSASSFPFMYYAAAITKPERGVNKPEELYLDAVALVCARAGSALDGARLVVDAGSRDKRARQRLAIAIRNRVNGEAGRTLLAEVREPRSQRVRT
ncbi:MAG TPA: hypothetical protein VKV26_16655 [Dehalococcoidia bacterium]|nr:hypothetical protein [Dehalococcoidia bacterium]